MQFRLLLSRRFLFIVTNVAHRRQRSGTQNQIELSSLDLSERNEQSQSPDQDTKLGPHEYVGVLYPLSRDVRRQG
jgi:hypothetical protein